MSPYAPTTCRVTAPSWAEQKPGSFTGHYSLEKIGDNRVWWWTVAEYSVRLNTDFPLTYRSLDGRYWRPKMRFCSDMGSVPAPAQLWVQKDSALRAFLVHDSAYEDHALFSSINGSDYAVRAMSRAQADDLLREMCAADGMTGWRVGAVYRAVQMCGRAAWDDRGPAT